MNPESPQPRHAAPMTLGVAVARAWPWLLLSLILIVAGVALIINA